MKLHVIGSNQTVLTIKDGVQILFSYDTPVAVRLDNGATLVVDGKLKEDSDGNIVYSKTTADHINSWVDMSKVKKIPHAKMQELTTIIFK